jgi:hypothetical protein
MVVQCLLLVEVILLSRNCCLSTTFMFINISHLVVHHVTNTVGMRLMIVLLLLLLLMLLLIISWRMVIFIIITTLIVLLEVLVKAVIAEDRIINFSHAWGS